MENWAIELARIHESTCPDGRVFGVVLYTREHIHVQRMLLDNKLWEGLDRGSGPNWVVFAIRAETGKLEHIKSDDDSLEMMQAFWAEPDENRKLLDAFDIGSTEQLPALVVFAEASDGTLLKKAFCIDSRSIKTSYSSLKKLLLEVEISLDFLGEEDRRSSRNVFVSAVSGLEHWEYVKKGSRMLAKLMESIPDALHFGETSDATRSVKENRDAAFCFDKKTMLWEIAWQSSSATIKDDLKGLTFIRFLLLNQNESVHVFDLEDFYPNKTAGAVIDDVEQLKQLVNREWNDAVEFTTIMLARKHLHELRNRAVQLEETFESDSSQLESLLTQIKKWSGWLDEAYFEAKKNPAIDKAVARVGRNVNTAITKIRSYKMDALADHLENSIQRGREYSYRPDTRVVWQL